MLGTAADSEIARRLGRTVSSVKSQRTGLGIPAVAAVRAPPDIG